MRNKCINASTHACTHPRTRRRFVPTVSSTPSSTYYSDERPVGRAGRSPEIDKMSLKRATPEGIMSPVFGALMTAISRELFVFSFPRKKRWRIFPRLNFPRILMRVPQVGIFNFFFNMYCHKLIIYDEDEAVHRPAAVDKRRPCLSFKRAWQPRG